MLIRFDPFREMDRLTQQLWGQETTRATGMPMDAFRREDRVVARFDLPGVDPSSIDLTVEKNVLSVRAERSVEHGEGEEWLVAERPQGTFTRQLFLGDGLDADRVEAHYEHGVLTVEIPVAEQAKPRRVEITNGNGNGDGRAAAIDATSSAA